MSRIMSDSSLETLSKMEDNSTADSSTLDANSTGPPATKFASEKETRSISAITSSIAEATSSTTPGHGPVFGDLRLNGGTETGSKVEKDIPSDGSSESEIESKKAMPSQKRILAPKLVRQYGDYIRLMEDRVSSLELKLSTQQPVRRESKDQTRGSHNSIPQLNLVPWDQWKQAESKTIPEKHYAIDVLSNDPVGAGQIKEQVTASCISDESAGSPNDLVTLSEKSLIRRELPERIKINSMRILRILNYGLRENSFAYSFLHGLYLLRPFKLLAYQEGNVRKRLQDFEQARKNLKPETEDEYASEYMENSVPDIFFIRQDESKMTLSELTGFINDLRCLLKFIDEYINPVQSELLTRPRNVRFSELWYLFKPGSLAFVKDKNIPQKVWKIIQRTGGRKYMSRPEHIQRGSFENKFSPFMLDCYYLDYDGTRFVPVFHRFTINKFDDIQGVTFLPVYPFEVAVNAGLVTREALIKRGQHFVQCTKICHRHYSGRTQYRAPNGVQLSTRLAENSGNIYVFSESVESEVMIDFERALQEIPDWKPGMDELYTHVIDSSEYESKIPFITYDRDMAWDTRLSDEFMDAENEKWHSWDKSGVRLSEDDLLLLPDRVFAFVFRSRKWACLHIGLDAKGEERIKEVKPRPDAWNDLELPDGHKNIVQSLIESHFMKGEKRLQFDLVRDKGKGIIILLHGVPGVGKTSTAECVAESSSRPLLPITCGDLGMTAREVESKLQSSFQLAQAWDCVMLLDEADIFLAQRTALDIHRNALVSVFLRVLEYYEGILFLTTNRVGAFDEAFKSRIHMALYYPPLSWQQTKKIWESQFRRTMAQNDQIVSNETELVRFAEDLYTNQVNKKEFGPVWNGRQIRNAFQSAIAVASFMPKDGDSIGLKKEHFEKIAIVSNHFNNYLWRVKKGQTDADLAGVNMTRADNYEPSQTSYPYQQAAYRADPPLQSTFGQTQAPAPSSGAMHNFHVPQQMTRQQIYTGNLAPHLPTPQFGGPQVYSSQGVQSYTAPAPSQGQQHPQQEFYPQGFMQQSSAVGMQPPPHQQHPAQGQQGPFYPLSQQPVLQQPQQDDSSM